MAPPTPGTRPPVPPLPGQLSGTEPLTRRNIRRLLVMTVLHLDSGVFGVMVFVAAMIGGLQLIGDVAAGRPADAANAAGWAVTVLASCLISVPLSFMWSLRRLRSRGWLVGYFDQTATLLVHPSDQGAWDLTDHHATRRGRGLAQPFRERVFRHLAGEADGHHVVIIATTLVPKLARSYQTDMPGLAITGDRGRDPIGRRLYHLRREPVEHPDAVN